MPLADGLFVCLFVLQQCENIAESFERIESKCPYLACHNKPRTALHSLLWLTFTFIRPATLLVAELCQQVEAKPCAVKCVRASHALPRASSHLIGYTFLEKLCTWKFHSCLFSASSGR